MARMLTFRHRVEIRNVCVEKRSSDLKVFLHSQSPGPKEYHKCNSDSPCALGFTTKFICRALCPKGKRRIESSKRRFAEEVEIQSR